ncbi:MAG TPA: TIGR03668 family PPOX class F420-dependent oxidoreductase [Roseiflexaceae bacterium]|nr:TIGR03668 family PPOX class F420-dependent oxidoreductase [Roseiflexaceae bacterium]
MADNPPGWTLGGWELALLEEQRVAHLATVDADGQPSALPVVYAFDGERVLIPLDGKPKRGDVRELRRVRDIAANPQVALVVDRYADDWSRLAWVQIRGRAALLESGPAYERGLALLRGRYPQYAAVPLDGRPLIAITPTEVRSWRAHPSGSFEC